MAHYGKINGWVAVQPNQHLFCFGADYKPGSCRQQQLHLLGMSMRKSILWTRAMRHFCTQKQKPKGPWHCHQTWWGRTIPTNRQVARHWCVHCEIRSRSSKTMHMNSIELKVPFLGPVTKDKERHWFGNAKKPCWLMYQVWFWARKTLKGYCTISNHFQYKKGSTGSI